MMITSNQQTQTGAWAMVVLISVIPRLAIAQVPEQQNDKSLHFAGALYIDNRYMKNATRTPVENNEVDEWQSEYGANLRAGLDRDLVELSADYNFRQYTFFENTQRDRFIRTGQSALVIGTDNTFYQLDLGHSTQRFLADPGGPSTLDNTDQRDISTAMPLLRLRPGRGNSVAISGHYADVAYKEADANDSERIGYGVTWHRHVSPLYTLGVQIMENEIDYDIGESSDYTYRRAAFSLSAELRLLSYSLEIGGNEAEPVTGPTVDGTFYDFALAHHRQDNTFSFTAHRSITDTSLGNANSPFFSEGIASDVTRSIQDHLERQSYGLAWRSNIPCIRCDIALRAGYEDESYFNVTTENRTEYFIGTLFRYRLRPSTQLELGLNHQERDFVDGGRSEDYAELSAVVAVDIEQILRYFTTRLWYQHERRMPEEGLDYYTNAVGIRLAYAF